MLAILCSLLLFFSGATALDNGLGLTPQMGWNSWNHFHCNVNDGLIRDTAKAMVDTGLHNHGYEYVNIDDCWAKSRASDGTIQPDPNAFPDMKKLADYVHSLGLKFGLYSDAGTKTCAGRPASLGYETNDANTYAQWGVDYLKYDNCNNGGSKPEVRYPVMRDALNKTGRHIFFSMCEWGQDNPATWAPKVGNSWRTTGDIGDNWKSMISRADQNAGLWSYAGPGAWNDPDMLEVGNGGMTTDEYKTHFSLWCIMKAPLLIGCDLTKISDDALNILTNDCVIGVNQDPLGIQGNRTKQDGTSEVWQVPLKNGTRVALAVNRGDSATDITIQWTDIGFPSSASANVFDLWDGSKMIGKFTGSVTAKAIPTHGVAMYRVEPVSK